MIVNITLGEVKAALEFATMAIGVPNDFVVTGEITREQILKDVEESGANTAMGYTRDAGTASTLTLLRTLEFIGYEVEWPELWIKQAAVHDALQEEANQLGEVN